MKTVFVDAGHGGSFAGAVGPPPHNRQEKVINLAVAWEIFRYLRNREVSCLLSRYRDMEFDLDQGRDLVARVGIANRTEADLFVSIHADSVGDIKLRSQVEGFTVYHNPGSDMGRVYAQAISESMSARLTGRRSRGIKEKGFYVLRETSMPAVLVECGFICNPEESEWMFGGHATDIAEAIGNGVLKILNQE